MVQHVSRFLFLELVGQPCIVVWFHLFWCFRLEVYKGDIYKKFRGDTKKVRYENSTLVRNNEDLPRKLREISLTNTE